jgi:MoaA/NifB/PqqE/SkfB family radical SAM enzyme
MNYLRYKEKLDLYQYAAQNMSYMLGNKKLSPPIVLWLLSKRCNLKCKHCNFYLDRRKIDTDGLMVIAEKLAKSDSRVIDLSGGEPFIIPNIKDIITLLKQHKKKILINTNGFNLIEFADFLIEQEVESVTVSIDSTDADVHDAIRGKKGSFDRAVEALRYLKANRKGRYPHTAIRGVVMKDNFKVMGQYTTHFKGLVDEVKFQPVHDTEGFNEVVEKDTLFSERDMHLEEEFNKMFNEFAIAQPKFDNYYYRNFSKFLFRPEKLEQKALHHCLPVWMNFMLLMEDGTCRTCAKTIGNLKEQSLQDVWTGKERLGYLRSMSKFGRCKIPCWMNCTGVAPEWQGKVLKQLLKVGPLEKGVYDEFKKSPNYTGTQNP